MKQWEEEWHQQAHCPEIVEGETNLFVAEFEDADKARLATVAPKMARALRMVLAARVQLLSEERAMIESALTEAGVPLP